MKKAMPFDLLTSRSSPLNGEITIPGDKSISHRAIMLASIAESTTLIEGFLQSEDCFATMKAFQLMGVQIELLEEQKVRVLGVGKFGLLKPKERIDCMNSGTTMRLLTGILAAQPFESELIGDASLLKRPMKRISDPLTLMGASVKTNNGRPPLQIAGGNTLQGIDYVLPQASAQVKSCLLLAGLYAKGKTSIQEQQPSRNHTETMLSAFSYPIETVDGRVVIDSKHTLQGTTIKVPGDLSSAAFFIVAASIIKDSNITILNVGVNPTRSGAIEILQRMGASITLLNRRCDGLEEVADLHIQYRGLKGITIPEELVPLAIDEFPILFIAAACASGVTVLRGAKELRFKESDRIGIMAQGLSKLGITATVFDDGISIQGGSMRGGVIECDHDHRVAMAFSIAGAVADGSITIKNCETIATSFPQFVEKAEKLGLHLIKKVTK